MFLDNKIIFLSGATGMAGTNIMRYILENYPTVKIKAVYHKNTRPFIKNKMIQYVYGELKSESECKKMVKGCDCAIMAAANTTGIGATMLQAREQTHDNLIMNEQMLKAFYLENIRRVVYIGSATLYQEFDGCIKEEDLDLNKEPPPAYFGIGWVARFIEKLCKFYHEQFGIQILIVRAANIFGPYAKFNPQTSNFIPAIIRKAVERMEPFEVWGSPDVTRDVVYSEDFARAIVMMLDNPRITFDTFNIGSGTQTTVGEVASWALKYSGHTPLEIKYLPCKPTTIKSRALDCAKAKQILGWQPQYTVQEGIKKTTEWWIKNKNWWTR